ncbi:MAG: Coenzyme F420 hydrogenase/dehydrogenase, beta subunit C-terminal domain [Dehalococcoidia bacterium]|nr:Coenzyme F420 hydrogenase/dehydrogenase, beta subunit C-terminal domain [Dehalococcoidia bacterium]
MAKTVSYAVRDGSITGAMRRILRELLEKALVDAVLVPMELPSRENVVQSVVTQPAILDAANPLAPVLPVNTASIVSKITRLAPSEKKLAVVARPCELRALVELVKLKQASLRNIVLIGMDCFGTYSVTDYKQFAKENQNTGDAFVRICKAGEADSRLREACQICEYPYPLVSDITVGLIGRDFDTEIGLLANTAVGEQLLDGLGLPEAKDDGRQAAIEEMVAARVKRRDEVFAQTIAETKGLERLISVFAPCIGCHNCRDMCPICYCRECVFDSDTFAFEADKYFGWSCKKGALRVPTDTLLFHLTRLNHMDTSCVGCGLCQAACPNNVPVFRIFRLVGSRVQPLFGYVPGRSIDDPLPLTTFKEAEFEKVGFE